MSDGWCLVLKVKDERRKAGLSNNSYNYYCVHTIIQQK